MKNRFGRYLFFLLCCLVAAGSLGAAWDFQRLQSSRDSLRKMLESREKACEVLADRCRKWEQRIAGGPGTVEAPSSGEQEIGPYTAMFSETLRTRDFPIGFDSVSSDSQMPRTLSVRGVVAASCLSRARRILEDYVEESARRSQIQELGFRAWIAGNAKGDLYPFRMQVRRADR